MQNILLTYLLFQLTIFYPNNNFKIDWETSISHEKLDIYIVHFTGNISQEYHLSCYDKSQCVKILFDDSTNINQIDYREEGIITEDPELPGYFFYKDFYYIDQKIRIRADQKKIIISGEIIYVLCDEKYLPKKCYLDTCSFHQEYNLN
jgi:hypothetical protein